MLLKTTKMMMKKIKVAKDPATKVKTTSLWLIPLHPNH
jgi:hypothetical protein